MEQSSAYLYGIELKEIFGLNIEPKDVFSLEYNEFGKWRAICWFGKKYRRIISCSVDGRQPKNERLFTLSFPTGAYLFGNGGMFDEDYPTAFFQKFWMELKTYNPDFVDDVNHCLYWRLDNAKEIFNSFDDILKKYHELNKER